MLPDEGPSQETIIGDRKELQQRRQMLDVALKKLNPRERDIIFERRLKDEPSTLEELSPPLCRVARAHPADRGARLREAAARDARANPPHPPGQPRDGGCVRQVISLSVVGCQFH